ncbi:MAG: response regulator transcription factor [Verrucomicrobia bacterium]|nr:response regulator transcription factor [Verrucomicrobiota bacterium]
MSHSKRPPRPAARKRANATARAKPAPEPGIRRIRLLLVDDHPVLREGLRSCFSRLPQLLIVGEAASGEDALRQARRLKPDVVLMDINMPGMNGLVATARMRKLAPGAKVLILSVHENREYVAEVARSGARGYILKDASPAELVRAIEAVHRGGGFFSPSVAAAMLKSLGGPTVAPAQPDLAWLTARERDVLALIATGASSKSIGGRLGVALSTVKTLRERLMRKLDLHTVAAVTHFAVAQGLTVSRAGSRSE